MICCLEAHTLTGWMKQNMRDGRRDAFVKLQGYQHMCSRVEHRPSEKVQGGHNRINPDAGGYCSGKNCSDSWFVDDGRHDTSLMPRLVCLGRISYEGESDEPRQTARMDSSAKT